MKIFEARPWLVALVSVIAALASWMAGDAVVAAAPLSVEIAVPLAWIYATICVAGLSVLLVRTLGRRRRAVRGQTPPTVSDSPHVEPVGDAHRPGGVAAEPAPAAALDTGEPHAFYLELDRHSRIVRCGGGGSSALADDPATLIGQSLLELVPSRVRGVIVEAARGARTQPGRSFSLPKLRLRRTTAAGQRTVSPPLRLKFQARDDATLIMHGQVDDSAGATGIAQDGNDERFSRVFHSSPDAILVIRYDDGTVIDFNNSFTRLLGYTREQAIGQPVADLELWMAPEDRRALLERFSRERHVTDLEARLRNFDGHSVPVELSLRFIELDGELCVLCIARDISKRLEAERAARSSEEKFTQVFTQSPDGVVVISSRDFVIREVNAAFLRGSGYAAQEIIGQSIRLFQTGPDSDELEQTLEALVRQGRVANREMRFRTKDGRELTALVSGTVTDIDGEPCLLCIIKDISDLRHAQEQLRRSEERFRGAFENAPIGILLLDPLGHIFQANRFATELLGYSDGALANLHVSRLVPADERADLKEQLERLLRGNDSALRSERRLLCADGLEIWTNCHVVLQRDGHGQPLYCIAQIADITEMKTSQRRMEHLAFYDTLTELANRRLFNDRLQQAVEHCRRHDLRAALLYLDLDQFKRVNDTLGHECGDALLKEVAARLIGCVRKEDTVGRPGGDEFTILLHDLDNPDHAATVARKILRALERPITISGHQLVVTTSIGITVIPDDGEDPNALTKNADLAMYRAKEEGRNTYQFFSEELNTNAVHRLRTEYELRRALERSEFELHFQPTVRLTDQAVVGVECLLRWNHPERGLVMPDEFIGIAEETGAIVEIGNWVIEEACAAGRLMADQHGAPLCIAVNISPRQFRDPRLVDNIRQSLQRAQLDAGSLELEITETMLMQDVDAASTILTRLHELGIRLAIDDFGTGYSSLNYLKKFPINTVKVDRTFITDIPQNSDDMEITAAVIAMAHRLRMQVVAEGVESSAQLEFLAEQQCDFAQGYLFSRALPLSEVGKLLGGKVALLRTSA